VSALIELFAGFTEELFPATPVIEDLPWWYPITLLLGTLCENVLRLGLVVLVLGYLLFACIGATSFFALLRSH
jgi:hypothetical protein